MSSPNSVFIPRMFSNISANRISHIFRHHKIGEVEKVDLIEKTNSDGKKYNMAFIHFAGFYDTPEAQSFRRDVEDPKVKAKLVYEGPWHWIVLPFENKKSPAKTSLNTNVGEFILPTQPQMVQFCVMTPQGPMWQWGFPAMPLSTPIPTASLIPPQVMYGKRQHKSHNKPRMRINVPNKDTDKPAIIVNDDTVTMRKRKRNRDDDDNCDVVMHWDEDDISQRNNIIDNV